VQRLIAGSRASLPVAPIATTPITPSDYGKVADALRRELRVAQVVCLT
jgi:hypothetical protein